LEAAILQAGPETVAAFVFEPVVGAAGGCVPAPETYARRVREICTKYGVLMIADEVMCGAGRCGPWRALETDGVEPDIMSVAKGLAGGYMPSGVDAVGDIRGRGHFICAELVANRDTKAPFDPELKLFMQIRQQAMDNGLICYPVGGNVDGVRGDIVILAPPYNATDAELAEIVEKAALSIRQVLRA
jgi:adenosylmethionine-8-amino-7-oxononanoate aminotransferase